MVGFGAVQTIEAFRPFCLLRLPSFLWSAYGGYPTRPEICHRHISISDSPPQGEAYFTGRRAQPHFCSLCFFAQPSLCT